MSLGYNYSDYNEALDFTKNLISEIKASSFDNPATWLGSCNLGLGGMNSFAQAWVEQVGGTTWAFDGKSSYENIMYPVGYIGWLPWFWSTRSSIINARKEFGFSLIGSKYYPGAGCDAEEVKFTR